MITTPLATPPTCNHHVRENESERGVREKERERERTTEKGIEGQMSKGRTGRTAKKKGGEKGGSRNRGGAPLRIRSVCLLRLSVVCS